MFELSSGVMCPPEISYQGPAKKEADVPQK